MQFSSPNHHTRTDLRRYRYHTGAELRPLEPGETCPLLFRDIGPEATGRFLRNDLQRLAGPFSPIIYLRTWEYLEPYTDYEQIGRLIILQPEELQVWHSGVETIYVAPADISWKRDSVGFVPGSLPLSQAAELFSGAECLNDLADAYGRTAYQEACQEHLAKLDRLNRELQETEQIAEPLRRELQSGNRAEVRELMNRVNLSESDLCTAWHHLPHSRRAEIREILGSLPQEGWR